jgi:DNA ligase D
MATAAEQIDVSGRTVRVSSPDREVYAAHAGAKAITKLDVVNYYVAVGDAMLQALRERPTTLERWPKGVFEGAVLSTRQDNRGDAFYQKRIPKGAPEWVETARIQFPSGRHADEVCPTEPAVIAWAAQMGTIVFHPWPVRRSDVEHPDELRIDLDPQPGTDFADAAVVAGEARGLLDDLGMAGFPKTSGGRGLHIYVRIEPRWSFTDVRRSAIAFGRELERRLPERVTTKWWKEERGERVFVDYNQNARDRTIASAFSLRPRPGAPVSTPLRWEEIGDADPSDFTLWTVPERLKAVGNPMEGIDDRAYSLEALLEMYARDEREGLGDMPYPPDYPKMPGEPPRVQPSRINPANWEDVEK